MRGGQKLKNGETDPYADLEGSRRRQRFTCLPSAWRLCILIGIGAYRPVTNTILVTVTAFNFGEYPSIGVPLNRGGPYTRADPTRTEIGCTPGLRFSCALCGQPLEKVDAACTVP